MKKKLVIAAVLSLLIALPLVAYWVPNKPLSDKELDSFKEGYGDHPTVLVYGVIGVKRTQGIHYMHFFQPDSRLPASVIGSFESLSNTEYVYFGEPMCDVNYRLYRLKYVETFPRKTEYLYMAKLDTHTKFDFKAPKETGIYYLGMKDIHGDILLDDPNELKYRVDALKKLQKKYKKTDWINLIDEELENVQAMLSDGDAK